MHRNLRIGCFTGTAAIAGIRFVCFKVLRRAQQIGDLGDIQACAPPVNSAMQAKGREMKAATPRRAARLEPERKAEVRLRRFGPYTEA